MDDERKNVPAVVDPGARMLSAMSVDRVRREIEAVKQFQSLVMSQLVEGIDYGTIPGTKKPTLLKSGAEKIAKLLALADLYEIIEQVEDWEKPLFSYTIRCSLAMVESGKVVSQGVGECNSMESKYRFRWVYPSEVPEGMDKSTLPVKTFKGKKGQNLTQYRLPNDDVFSLRNTFLKMAKKRALVDAALSVGRLSGIVTQDLDELKANGHLPDVEDIEEEKKDTHPPNGEPVIAVNEEEAQRMKELYELAKIDGCTKEKAAKMLEKFGAISWTTLPKKHFETVCAYLKEWVNH